VAPLTAGGLRDPRRSTPFSWVRSGLRDGSSPSPSTSSTTATPSTATRSTHAWRSWASPASGHRSGRHGRTPSASASCAQYARSVWTTRSSSTSDTCILSSPSTSPTTTLIGPTEASVCRARCLEAQLATEGSSGDRY
jgi:hypothetical protein